MERVRSLQAPADRRLGRGVLLAYGLGAVAYGVKDSGFGTFLLLFYNQVLGLPSASVGLVIMAALVLDAFIDPMVGILSDRTRSRWGRRHPWMYAAALPIMIGWMLLWSPPAALGQGGLLVWLFVAAIGVRAAVSCYEVPSVALTPELSSDYDERTRIMAYRYLFGWAGGLLMLASAYVLFLAPRPGFPNGLLYRPGYHGMALTGALAMGVAILVSALATHREIPRLLQAGAVAPGVGAAFQEMLSAGRNRGFMILLLGGLCSYTNQGLNYALSNYFYSYVWLFKGAEFLFVAVALFAGVLVAFTIAKPLSLRLGKARGAALMAIAAYAAAATPYLLRLIGWFPEPATTASLVMVLGSLILSTGCGVSTFILGSAMLADVVEDSEATTGRRNEGLFFAGGFFVQKCTSGLGIFLAGVLLAAAGFPKQAHPGSVPVPVLDRLTLIYLGLGALLATCAALAYLRFPFGRAEHEARIAART
ncbi:MFS transporter [Sphingomonas sp. KRR8]|uniref:MFS transporter n=1 Tax=Sphingomonas sp. KRR8 TaxID=2942996 RepID=UPI0020224551|nr:MFS transporter [Sphingomonas sp. KRR8]URD62028.1 MFS transporter [Sphingomonas sp. KRR8]